MTKFLVLAVFIFFSLPIHAQEGLWPKHVVSVGTDGLGWSGAGISNEWDKSKSGIKEQTASTGELSLNYNYIFSNRFMAGVELNFELESSETKLASGDKKEEDQATSTLAISVGYNFNEDIFNSWWMKISLGGGSVETETKDTTATPVETDSEIGVGFFTIEGGKRFNFESVGLKNISFSPSIALTSATYSEDADDTGLESSVTLQLNILKFDVIF